MRHPLSGYRNPLFLFINRHPLRGIILLYNLLLLRVIPYGESNSLPFFSIKSHPLPGNHTLYISHLLSSIPYRGIQPCSFRYKIARRAFLLIANPPPTLWIPRRGFLLILTFFSPKSSSPTGNHSPLHSSTIKSHPLSGNHTLHLSHLLSGISYGVIVSSLYLNTFLTLSLPSHSP